MNVSEISSFTPRGFSKGYQIVAFKCGAASPILAGVVLSVYRGAMIRTKTEKGEDASDDAPRRMRVSKLMTGPCTASLAALVHVIQLRPRVGNLYYANALCTPLVLDPVGSIVYELPHVVASESRL